MRYNFGERGGGLGLCGQCYLFDEDVFDKDNSRWNDEQTAADIWGAT